MNYTVKEVAKKLRVSRTTIYNLISKGEVERIGKIRGAIRISGSELRKLMMSTASVIELSCNPEKVDILETHIGKIRKLKNQNWYMLRDLCKLVGISDSFTVSRRASQNVVRNMSLNEAQSYGIRATHTGVLVITLEGIEEYALKTRIDINWARFLEEIQIANNPVIQEAMNFVEETKQENGLQIFEGHEVEIIEVNGELLFELYSTGMALGQVVKNAKGQMYPNKERIDKNVASADIKPCLRNANNYLTEPMLYDLMLEMKTDKVKPFRKWVTGTVLPSINKTGGYVANTPKFTNSYFNNFSKELRKEMEIELSSKAYSLYEEKEKLDKQVLESIRLLEELQGTLR